MLRIEVNIILVHLKPVDLLILYSEFCQEYFGSCLKMFPKHKISVYKTVKFPQTAGVYNFYQIVFKQGTVLNLGIYSQ